MKKFLTIVFVLFAATSAYAEQPAPTPAVEKPLGIGIPEEPATSGFAVTGVIVVLCAFGAYAVIAAKKKKQVDDVMQVIGRQALGGRARLMLVAVRDRELLLSVNEKGASLLAEWPGEPRIEEPEEAPEAHDELEQAAAPTTSAAISGLLRLRQKTEPRMPTVPPAPQRANSVAPAAWSDVFAQEMTQSRQSELAARQMSPSLRNDDAFAQLPPSRRTESYAREMAAARRNEVSPRELSQARRSGR
jgi:flagellar biogenesis protein FliO